MPGRQANGRPLMPTGNGGKKNNKRSKSRANQKALSAFAIASDQYAERQKATPRSRQLDAEQGASRGGKHARDGEDDDDDDEDDEEMDGPPRKMRRSNRDDEVEYASDSSGNEWRIGVDDDDDSEIDSDDAFGESDEERYENYKSSKGKKKADDSDDDDDDDEMDDADGASLGSDAIDLAAALDMSDSEDEDDAADDGSESDESSTDASSQSDDGSSDDEEDDVDEDGVNAWVSQFSGVKDSDEQDDGVPKKKAKINLEDLGLTGLKDPQLKKSVKMLGKETKSTKAQKLDVPLAARQQARLDRGVAYEKTKETLDRWNDTVKQNRRADHLVFPLPQNMTGIERHDNTELQSLDQKAPGNELESTIMAIMEESGLGPSAQKKKKNTEDGDDDQTLSQGDLKGMWAEKRRQRELKSQEDKRAKRIKKIKSKAYHRVHRKQRERDAIKEHDALAAAGEIDSDEERETQDRQRAMERMGARHRESKWAKMSNKNGRAAWDEDVRMGLTDMARRDEELRRRIDGRPAKSNGDDEEDDDESDDSGDSDMDQRQRLLRKLDNAGADDDSEPRSKLLNMDFMKRAEASKKKANDEMVAQIRRDLASDDEDAAGSGEETEEVGRKQFGQPSLKTPFDKPAKPSKKNKKAESSFHETEDTVMNDASGKGRGLSAPSTQTETTDSAAGGAWSQVGPSKKQRGKKNTSSSAADVLDLGTDSVAVAPEAAPAKKTTTGKPQNKKQQGKQQSSTVLAQTNAADTSSEDDDDDDDKHMPVRFREQELLDKAFGGLDVVADFEREKAEIADEDDDKEVDNTLPGWGGWVGEGVSSREKKRHQGRFITKQEGVKRKADRKDAKLKDAILNEKRTKKTEKYLATQLPHPFESRTQYERSLRLPVGPEWMTKETIQETTKPRVLLKQGHIIAPMSRPS